MTLGKKHPWALGRPAMDGNELASRLHDLSLDDLPLLIALTGYGHPADRERSAAAGFADHLVKPVDLGRLARTISSLRNRVN